MIQIAILGMVSVLLAVQFKGGKSEYGTYITVTACLIIFFYGLTQVEVIFEMIEKMKQYLDFESSYFVILAKIIGITYIAEFTSGICKDTGYSALASQVELVGKLSVLTISMPILIALMDTVNQFFG